MELIFYRFEALWQAFDAPGGIAVLCAGPATEVLEVMGTRETLIRENGTKSRKCCN